MNYDFLVKAIDEMHELAVTNGRSVILSGEVETDEALTTFRIGKIIPTDKAEPELVDLGRFSILVQDRKE